MDDTRTTHRMETAELADAPDTERNHETDVGLELELYLDDLCPPTSRR